MSDYQKVTTHRIVVGATPDVMRAAREASAKVARDFYAEAILKGRCDSDELVLACATAILTERERCASVAEMRHERWRMPHPDDALPGEVRDDISACEDIAAAIRRGDAL